MGIHIDHKRRIITVYDGIHYDSGDEDYLRENYPNYQIVVDYGKDPTTTKGNKKPAAKKKKAKPELEIIGCDGIEFQIENGALKKAKGSADTVTIPEQVKEIYSKAFGSKCSVHKIIVPETVQYIGFGAFANCEDLEEIELPAHMTELPDCLFEECKNLKMIRIPSGVTFIGEACFFNCTSLSDIILPEGLQKIKRNAFANTCSLTSIRFPASLIEIEHGAFSCSGLETLEFPQGIKYISGFSYLGNKYCLSGTRSAFTISEKENFDPNHQTGIRYVNFPDSVITINDFKCNDLLEKVELSKNLEKISGFAKCVKLSHIELPETLKIIVSGCFDGCFGLKEIYLPEGLEEIGENAFRNCKELRLESLPASIKKLGLRAFEGCDQISSLTFAGGFPEKSNSNSFSKEQIAGKDIVFEGCIPGFTVRSAVGFQTQENYTIEATCYPTEITLEDLAYIALCKSGKSPNWQARVKYMISNDQAKEIFSLMVSLLQRGDIVIDNIVVSSALKMIDLYCEYANQEDIRFIREKISA